MAPPHERGQIKNGLRGIKKKHEQVLEKFR